MCTCGGVVIPIVDWALMGKTFVDHPIAVSAVIGVPLSVAWMITEFVIRREKRNNLRQQMMYERQETVFYVSPRDKALLRPALTPTADPGELLRSAEPISSTPPANMLRASGAADSSANTN